MRPQCGTEIADFANPQHLLLGRSGTIDRDTDGKMAYCNVESVLFGI